MVHGSEIFEGKCSSVKTLPVSHSEGLVSSATAAKDNQFCVPSAFGIVVETINNLGCKDKEGLRVVENKKLSEYF